MQAYIKRSPGAFQLTDHTGCLAAARRSRGIWQIQGGGCTYCARAEGSGTNRRYVLLENSRAAASAVPVFGRAPALLPPRAVSMAVATDWGEYQVLRRPDCGADILQDGRPAGGVSPFFSLRPQRIDWKGPQPPAFLAGLYALITYMMQEDDVDLI